LSTAGWVCVFSTALIVFLLLQSSCARLHILQVIYSLCIITQNATDHVNISRFASVYSSSTGIWKYTQGHPVKYYYSHYIIIAGIKVSLINGSIAMSRKTTILYKLVICFLLVRDVGTELSIIQCVFFYDKFSTSTNEGHLFYMNSVSKALPGYDNQHFRSFVNK